MAHSDHDLRLLGFNKVIDIDDFLDPELRNIIRDMYPHATKEWPTFPSGYEHRKQWEYAMCYRTFLHSGTLTRKSRILGVGAGKEDTLYYLTKFVHQVVATDLYVSSESWGDFAPIEMLTNPAQFSPYPDFEPARLIVQDMDARQLGYPDNSFDGVFSLGSIEHFGSFKDIAQAAAEMGRVLRPGGILSVATEYRIDGPEGGTGSDGLRFLGIDELREYIVKPSGLRLIDQIRTEQSPKTLSNVYPVQYSFEGGPRGWSFFPHLAFLHPHGYTFCSVHLALQKPMRPPSSAAILTRPLQLGATGQVAWRATTDPRSEWREQDTLGPMTRRWVRRLRRARELPRRLAALQHEITRLHDELSGDRRRIEALERIAGLPVEPSRDRPWPPNLLRPDPDVYRTDRSEPFMADSTPTVRDFLHPRFAEITAILATPHGYHRKMWEWVLILHTALERGVAEPGRQAVGFGVGAAEPIAAALAKFGMTVTATDAPDEIGEKWLEGGQYAATADDLRHDGIVDEETFSQRVHYERCDMNDIPARLSGYDFVWSSSCLEHLGDLRKGLDFVMKTVEQTLKVGGIACHTTELNVSSNKETIETGGTVIYRKHDLDELVARLRAHGHFVDPISIAPSLYPPDWWVDTPPYLLDPHLKLEFGGFAITSVALVVERGR